jgi:DNA-binding MarR family transcriptional regulator/GNAT superfamily N-acetyltransferase
MAASPSPRTAPSDEQVASVRRFNRFYTRRIGVLDEGLLQSALTLTEARVLWEIVHREAPSPGDLRQAVGVDGGYLTRILQRFQKRGLVTRRAASDDARRAVIHLTPRGRTAFGELDVRTRRQVAGLLEPLAPADRARLAAAMATIEALLEPPTGAAAPVSWLLRPLQPGDLGWVVQRHGVLYAEEYGWDERFEALVAGVVADYVRRFDAARDRAWVAERDGAPVGSIFLVHRSQRVAQLRLLLVEPSARGLGIGRRLVEECLRFARRAGYREVTLWTNDVLLSARRIYEAAGFHLVQQAPHTRFGRGLVGQTWSLPLAQAPRGVRRAGTRAAVSRPLRERSA